MAQGMAALALLLALVACSQARELLTAPLSISGTAVVFQETIQGQQPRRLLAVHTADGTRVPVDASPVLLRKLTTGTHVVVKGKWKQQQQQLQQQQQAAAARTAKFEAAEISASGHAHAHVAPLLTTLPLPAAPTSAAAAGAAVAATSAAPRVAAAAASPATLSINALVTLNVNTIVIPIAAKAADGAACPNSQLPKYSVDAVNRTIFAELNPTGVTVGSTYNKCSGGRSKLTTANSMVAAQVDLPCNGETYRIAWNFSKCDFDDFNGWADAADEALAARGMDLSKYKYRVYLVPPGTCGWVGLGYVGCDGSYTCRTWISGDFWTSPQAIAHELGHNLFMAHAGANNSGIVDQYGDGTCLLGACCSNRCPNTPHTWQMGWLSLCQLDGTALRPGKTVTATIYAQAQAVGVLSRAGGVRVQPTWVPGQAPIFVGYRTRTGGDAQLDPTLAGRVHIYASNISSTYDPQPTMYKGGLARGASYTDPDTSLVVRVTGMTSATATITLCRRVGTETLASCKANLDGDCNGLVGTRDPACAKLLAADAAAKRAKQALMRRSAV